MLPGRPPEKTDLPPVTTAPFAEQQMKPESKELQGRERVIERFGLKAGGFAAGGRQQTRSRLQGGDHVAQGAHLKQMTHCCID
jgi:hypothetical protein